MDLGISGRTALVTGASTGLGLACAQALAAEGVRVALASRSAEKLAAAAATLPAAAPAAAGGPRAAAVGPRAGAGAAR